MILTTHIKKYIKKNKNVNLILSGGNSPLKYYRLLSKEKLNWEKINFFFIDERNVDINSKYSNFKKINKIFKKNILQHKLKPLNKKFLSEKLLNKKIFLLKKYKTISIIGMGNDGHYASIFSNSKKFKKLININLKPNILSTEKIGNPKVKRFTMNLSMILLSSKIFLILNNQKKIILFKKAIKFKNEKIYPIYSLIKKAKNRILIFDGKRLKKIKDFSLH